VVESVDRGYGESTCEAFDSLEKAQEAADENGVEVIWSIYGHIPRQGVECIGDFSTEAHAFVVLERISGIKGLSGQTIYLLQ
jgi:hypothetical protein